MYSQPFRSAFELLTISMFLSDRVTQAGAGSRPRRQILAAFVLTCCPPRLLVCVSGLSLRETREAPGDNGGISLSGSFIDILPVCSKTGPESDCSPPPLLCLCPLAASASSSSPPVTWHSRSWLSSSVSTRWCRPGNTFRTSERRLPGLIPAGSFFGVCLCCNVAQILLAETR